MLSLLLETLFPGPIFAGYAERLMARDWAGLPRGAQIAQKDNAHCLEAAQAMGADLPLFRLVRDRLAIIAAAGEPADVTALAREVARRSGLPD